MRTVHLNQCSRVSVLLLVFCLSYGCAKGPPAPIAANTSVVGSWRSSYSLSPGEVVMPGAAEGVGQVLNFQITFFRDGTFSKSGGVPVQGTWVQSGREVTINADKFAIGEKTYGLGKASMLSDLELSANGKVLSERGRGGINYTRG